MSIASWPAALAFAWRPENDGQPYHVTSGDPGGGTSYGVIEATWSTACARGIVSGSLAYAARVELARVLYEMFWKAVQGDSLPVGIDLVVFDMGMLAGPGRAAIDLQRAVGVTQDGDIGPITLAATKALDAATLLNTLVANDEDYFAGLGSFTTFGGGWDRRAADAKDMALSMIYATTVVA